MALVPKIQTDTSLLWDTTRKTIKVTDTTGNYNATTNPTGYGSPNPTKASIVVTRQIISSYQLELDAGSVSGTYTPYQEYQNKGTASLTFDSTNSKTAIVNAKYFPFYADTINGIPYTTGRYRVLAGFVPSVADSYIILNTQLGLSSTEVIPDGTYTIVTDYFQNVNVPSGSLVAGTDYIVGGDVDAVLSYANIGSPEVYGEFALNEVFTASSNANWTTISGSVQVYAKVATSSYSFLIANDSFIKVQEVQTRYVNNKCKCGADLTALIYEIDNLYSTLLKCVTPNYFNPTLAQTLINEIAQKYDYIINSFC